MMIELLPEWLSLPLGGSARMRFLRKDVQLFMRKTTCPLLVVSDPIHTMFLFAMFLMMFSVLNVLTVSRLSFICLFYIYRWCIRGST